MKKRAPTMRESVSPFHAVAEAVADLVSQENRAYGDSFSTAGSALRLLYPRGIQPGQMDDALAIARVWDKLSRVATDNDPSGESPWMDICGYALLALSRNLSIDPEHKGINQCDSASGLAAPTSSETTTASAGRNAES
jgi:hypothetical protein